MPEPGWFERYNEQVVRWAEEYRRWRRMQVRDGLFPPHPQILAEIAEEDRKAREAVRNEG